MFVVPCRGTMYGERKTAETKYRLWWPLAQQARYHTNTRKVSYHQHGDSPTLTTGAAELLDIHIELRLVYCTNKWAI